MTQASVVEGPAVGDGSPTTLRRIARMLAPYRNKMLLVGLAVVVSALLGILSPFLTKAVFDSALFPSDGRPPDFHLLGWLVAGLCVVPIATALIGMGITSLSMAARAVRPVGAQLSRVSLETCEAAAEAALGAPDPMAARAAVREVLGH